MTDSKDTGRVLMGRITGAQGLRGEVKIHAFTGLPEDIAAYGPLASEDGARQFEILELRTAKGSTVIAQLKGIGDRNAAEALQGERLYVARSQFPEPDEDEFYVGDLVGMQAAAPDGTVLGKVTGAHNFGAGDLLEIELAATGKSEMIPFTKACVPDVDMKRRVLIAVMPE
jgi:16S rRNA processing protein RimM